MVLSKIRMIALCFATLGLSCGSNHGNESKLNIHSELHKSLAEDARINGTLNPTRLKTLTMLSTYKIVPLFTLTKEGSLATLKQNELENEKQLINNLISTINGDSDEKLEDIKAEWVDDWAVKFTVPDLYVVTIKMSKEPLIDDTYGSQVTIEDIRTHLVGLGGIINMVGPLQDQEFWRAYNQVVSNPNLNVDQYIRMLESNRERIRSIIFVLENFMNGLVPFRDKLLKDLNEVKGYYETGKNVTVDTANNIKDGMEGGAKGLLYIFNPFNWF